ncbi:MAG: sigma-70 family RNA polymerase sigma factor [Pseudomonadota bacterium]
MTLPPADLDALMERLAEGERAALTPLYRGLWPRCLALATRLLEDPIRAEDAAQQALLTLFEQASRFDGARGRVLAWALTLVAWECRTTRRKDARRQEEGDPLALSAVPSFEGDPEDAAIRAALLSCAQQALATLSPQDRETLSLAFGEVPPSQRAVPAATFRKRRQRALGRLQAAWRSLHDG